MAKNKRIKQAHIETEYTPDQIKEMAKCAKDPVYFTEKYVRVQHPVRGSIPLKLYGYQKKMLEAYMENRYTVVLSARQTGKCLEPDVRLTIRRTVSFNFSPINITKRICLFVLDNEKYNEIYRKKKM